MEKIDPSESLHYFGEREVEKQGAFKKARDSVFQPTVKFLTRLKITPDALSLIGALAMTAVPLILLADDHLFVHRWMCLLIALHLFCDGVDGPLARHQHRQGDHGAFVDICCDHFGMICITIAVMLTGLADPIWAGIYMTAYTIAIAFVIWLNHLGRGFRIVFRSKYILFLLYGAYAFFEINRFDELFIIFSAYNALLILWGFLRLRSVLRERSS